MNKVILVGRLAKDPELRSAMNGKSVCGFSVAVDRRYKQEGQPSADFFNVTAWGKQGEVLNGQQLMECSDAKTGRKWRELRCDGVVFVQIDDVGYLK